MKKTEGMNVWMCVCKLRESDRERDRLCMCVCRLCEKRGRDRVSGCV